MNENTSFLARWAKRKAEAQQANTNIATPVEMVIPEVLTEVGADINPISENAITPADAEFAAAPPALTDEDMPAIDTLDEQSDYSPFLSPEVTEGLRQLALRKLFHSPKFHIRDGLDDYDGDYTQFVALGNTLTADMKYQLAQEAERQLQQQLDKASEYLLNETPTESDSTATVNKAAIPPADAESFSPTILPDPQEAKA